MENYCGIRNSSKILLLEELTLKISCIFPIAINFWLLEIGFQMEVLRIMGYSIRIGVENGDFLESEIYPPIQERSLGWYTVGVGQDKNIYTTGFFQSIGTPYFILNSLGDIIEQERGVCRKKY